MCSGGFHPGFNGFKFSIPFPSWCKHIERNRSEAKDGAFTVLEYWAREPNGPLLLAHRTVCHPNHKSHVFIYYSFIKDNNP